MRQWTIWMHIHHLNAFIASVGAISEADAQFHIFPDLVEQHAFHVILEDAIQAG